MGLKRSEMGVTGDSINTASDRANVCIGDLALFGELAALAAWVRNYAARGARGCNVRKGYFARIGGARMGGEGSTSHSLAVCDTI